MDDTQSIKSELDQARKETEAVRTKLHNAVKKGKAIEIDRKQKQERIETLEEQLQEISDSR